MSRLAPFAVLVPLLLALSLAVAASSPLPVELPAVTPSGLLMALGALLGTLTLLWNARGRMPLRRCALGAGLVLLLSAFLSHLTWCLVSVDSLEALTGFDFFPALSDSLELVSEARADWEAFRQFDAVGSPSPKKKNK